MRKHKRRRGDPAERPEAGSGRREEEDQKKAPKGGRAGQGSGRGDGLGAEEGHAPTAYTRKKGHTKLLQLLNHQVRSPLEMPPSNRRRQEPVGARARADARPRPRSPGPQAPRAVDHLAPSRTPPEPKKKDNALC
ncbi:unnamed protein product [Boreogadus saida]